MSEEANPQARAGAPQMQAVDDSGVQPLYTNLCRVTGTHEEVVLDFGLNPTPFGPITNPIKVTQRIVCNYYTAKRLLLGLSMALQRHEQMFGSIELDPNKRVRSSSGQMPPGTTPVNPAGE